MLCDVVGYKTRYTVEFMSIKFVTRKFVVVGKILFCNYSLLLKTIMEETKKRQGSGRRSKLSKRNHDTCV